jgi:hypothetical protein
MKTKYAQLATILLIAVTGCGSTIASDEPYAQAPALQTMREYFISQPSFGDDLDKVQADMGGVSAATKTGNVAVVQIACENLSESASSALVKYYDAPVQPMLDAFQNLVDSAAACMAGDYTGATTYVNQASDNFTAATAQINAQG